MRFFDDALEMIKEVERDLTEMGTIYQSYSVQDWLVNDNPDYLTKEIIGYDYRLIPQNNDFKNLGEMIAYKKDSDFIEWIKAEASERIIPSCVSLNPGHAWKLRESFWGKYLRNGLFSYTYVERWQEQIDYVLKELQNHFRSRQVVMTMYDRHQDMMNWGGLDRVPCSLTYHFLIRNEKLYCVYSQRSCDFVNFFQADVYCTVILQGWLAEQIGIDIGPFTHCINSLHAFRKDLKGIF